MWAAGSTVAQLPANTTRRENVMQEASVTDQQLQAALRTVFGKSESVIVREDKKIWRAFHAQLPRSHKPITREQSKRCAEAEGLVYQELQPWGFCLYRKGAKMPELRPMAYTHEKGLHYVDAPASVSACKSKGVVVEPAQANGKTNLPQAKPAEKRTFKTPKQIAAEAAQLIEGARAAGRVFTCTDAVKKIISNSEIVILAEPIEPGPHLSGGQDSEILHEAQKLARQVSKLVTSEAAHGRNLTNAEALAVVTQKESAGDPKQLARQAQQHIDQQAALSNRVNVAKAVAAISQQNQ